MFEIIKVGTPRDNAGNIIKQGFVMDAKLMHFSSVSMRELSIGSTCSVSHQKYGIAPNILK